MMPRLPVIAVVGTNASGKSTLGVLLAKRLDGEVVSADSRQVYRSLDIGTGKLTRAEMSGVPHHLIDIRNPGESFSLAEYQTLAYEAIDAIRARGKVPLLVGGTALYLRSVIDGYQLVEARPDAGRREALERTSTEDLVARLRELDDQFLDRVDPRNRVRLVRTVEIAEAGFRYSETRRAEPRYEVFQLGLTWPRDVLRSRIDERLRRRIDCGMIEEVRALVAGGVSRDVLDRLGLEYRFVSDFLHGDYASVDELYERLSVAIHQFARRQLSWFLKDPRVHWLDGSGDFHDEAARLSESFLGKCKSVRRRR